MSKFENDELRQFFIEELDEVLEYAKKDIIEQIKGNFEDIKNDIIIDLDKILEDLK